ncbi:hypothetical protein [Oceanospirillum multiglobuliferum]|nr:hypothetical protein [Oceanospirillum multiglobuliferum]
MDGLRALIAQATGNRRAQRTFYLLALGVSRRGYRGDDHSTATS